MRYEKIQKLKEVLNLINFVGNVIALQICHKDEESLAKIVGLITDIRGVRVLNRFAVPIPPVSSKLSHTDRKITMILTKEPRRRFDSIARELSLSPRTVRRRLKKIAEERVLFACPTVNFSVAEGIIQADLLLAYDGAVAKESIDIQIRSHLKRFLIKEETGHSDFSVFSMALPSISTFREISAWAKSLRGIRYLHIGIVQESFLMFNRVGEILERTWAETLPVSLPTVST